MKSSIGEPRLNTYGFTGRKDAAHTITSLLAPVNDRKVVLMFLSLGKSFSPGAVVNTLACEDVRMCVCGDMLGCTAYVLAFPGFSFKAKS